MILIGQGTVLYFQETKGSRYITPRRFRTPIYNYERKFEQKRGSDIEMADLEALADSNSDGGLNSASNASMIESKNN